MIDNNIPTRINMTIASAERAIEFWLNNMIFRHEVSVSKISFTEKDHFTIEFIRDPKNSGLTSGE